MPDDFVLDDAEQAFFGSIRNPEARMAAVEKYRTLSVAPNHLHSQITAAIRPLSGQELRIQVS